MLEHVPCAFLPDCLLVCASCSCMIRSTIEPLAFTSSGPDEIRQLGSLANAAASAADVSGRPVAAVQLLAVSAICLGISAEPSGKLHVTCHEQGVSTA